MGRLVPKVRRDAGPNSGKATMKTLGQVAYESVNTKDFGYNWDSTSAGTKKEYEFLAQAVRSAVIEECAKVCDRDAMRKLVEMAWDWGYHASFQNPEIEQPGIVDKLIDEAIRSLK